MKIKIPSEIKVGIHTFKVSFKPYMRADDSWDGAINYRTGEINIDPLIMESMKDAALLHEIIHAIDKIYGCTMGHDDVDRMAQGIAVFLEDNLGIEFDWQLIGERG